MKIAANSIPKSGTHLLDRLLTLLGIDLVDLGGSDRTSRKLERISPRRAGA